MGFPRITGSLCAAYATALTMHPVPKRKKTAIKIIYESFENFSMMRLEDFHTFYAHVPFLYPPENTSGILKFSNGKDMEY